MSKINRIQDEIRQLGGGKFQKLGDRYLRRKSYEHINSIGSVFGKDKTRTGTPDSLISLSNGNYIFAEHTTNESDLFSKLKGDINKCLDVDKHGIPIEKIEKILLCYTDRLDPKEENELRELCNSKSVSLELFTLEDISSDLFLLYPKIAKDELGINIDTGQIVQPDDFIQIYENSSYSTSLSLALQFREEEKENALKKLAEKDLLIVSGPAGVGKTRLALEVAKEFESENSEYNIWCIFKRTVDLWEDLQDYFSAPGKYLIVVDDANRISSFEYIIDLLEHIGSNQEIKVIATVRDYALSKIKSEAYQKVAFNDLKLKPLSNDQIKEIVKDQFDISNHLFLDRIEQISKGNPRLAVMAAKIAKKEDSIFAISDVSELYDQYFKSVNDEIFNDEELKKKTELSSQTLLKTAAIISFLKAVDRDNKEMMNLIEKLLSNSENEFWESAKFLHEMEFVDMYETVVRMSDQVLGTYFFYLCFFKRKIIDFDTLLKYTFPQFKQRLIDSLNPVLSAFDFNSITESLKPTINKQIQSYKKEGKTDLIHDLLDTFWFVDETKTLVFAKELIQELTVEEISLNKIQFKPDNNPSFDQSALALLRHFSVKDKDSAEIALDLILDYAKKSPSDMPKTLSVLTTDFGFNLNSYVRRFEIQESVVDKLIERANNGNESYKYMFLAVAGQFLKTQFESSEMQDNRTLKFTTFSLPLSPDIKQLRSKIWEYIFQLGNTENYKEEVLRLVQNYSHSHLQFDQEKEIIEWESDLLLPYLTKAVNSSEYKDLSIFHGYLDLLDRNEVFYDEAIRKNKTNEIYELSGILLSDWADWDTKKYSYEEFQELKKAQINDFIKGYDINDFIKLIDACKVIKENPVNNRNDYLIRQRLGLVFSILAESMPDLFTNAFQYYLSIGDPFNIHGKDIIQNWLKFESPQTVLESLDDLEILNKDRWKFWLYEALPESEINEEEEYVEGLYELYEIAEAKFLPGDWNYLQKFESHDHEVVEQVLSILIERALDDPEVISAMKMLFMNFENIDSLIRDASNEIFESIKLSYLLVSQKENYADNKGKVFNLILDQDQEFIKEFVDSLYSEEAIYISERGDNRDFAFVWNRDDYKSIIDIAVEQLYKNEQKTVTLWRTNLEMFFHANFRENSSEEIQKKQFDYLKDRIIVDCKNINFIEYIFRVIKKFPNEKRRKLIQTFISCNKEFDDFKMLQLEPSSWGGVGSMVPVHAGRIKFFESLLPLMNSAELLFHKKYIEEKIEYITSFMESEKKSDFLRD